MLKVISWNKMKQSLIYFMNEGTFNQTIRPSLILNLIERTWLWWRDEFQFKQIQIKLRPDWLEGMKKIKLRLNKIDFMFWMTGGGLDSFFQTAQENWTMPSSVFLQAAFNHSFFNSNVWSGFEWIEPGCLKTSVSVFNQF